MVEKVKAWLASHKISTHTVALVIIGLVTAYNQVPQFQKLVLSIYSHFPLDAKNAVEALIALVLWYWRSQQPPQQPPTPPQQ